MSYAHFANYYDRLMEDMSYDQWLNFINECWQRYGKPSTLVDLGCGTGNITIPLVQSGIQVFGIDLSAEMLSVARNKSEHLLEASNRSSTYAFEPANLSWIQQDMREWELHHQVDCVVSFCDCFNYILEESELIQAFQQTFQGLKTGGLFIFDVHTPQLLIHYAKSQPFFMNEEDMAYIWTCDFEAKRCEIVHEMTLFVQDSAPHNVMKFNRIEETHVQRAYKLDWLKRQLLSSGFTKVACYGDFSWQPVNEHTKRAFFVCEKY